MQGMKRIIIGVVIVFSVFSVFSNNSFAKNQPGTHLGGTIAWSHTCLGANGGEISYAPSPVFRFGISLLNSDLAIEDLVALAMDENRSAGNAVEENIDQDLVTIASIKRQMALVNLRIFPAGNSFNVGLGGGIARLRGDLAFNDVDSGNQVKESVSYEQTVAFASIGNLWSWTHTYLAIDWVGTGRIMSFKKTAEDNDQTVSLSPSGQSGRNEFYDKLENLGERGGGIYLNFTFGLRI